MKNRQPALKKKSCTACNGSGQVSYFKGVSRFLLTSEECPECAGLGFIPTDHENDRPATTKPGRHQSRGDGQRAKLHPGLWVRIVQKQDQRSGRLTAGIIKDILTRSASHPHGIKVRLETGEVGRVKEIVPEAEG